MKLLDLFCGAGGAGEGYRQAGFEVTGVDIDHHTYYPGTFIQADALEYLAEHGHEYDVIHASPPCQRWSTATRDRERHPDLITPLRPMLRELGVPFIIENVPGAPLIDPVTLCGSSFGLGVRRHRRFETSFPVTAPPCKHAEQGTPWGVYGDHGSPNVHHRRPSGGSRGRKARDAAHACEVMGVPYPMAWVDAKEAIPPAFTRFLGKTLVFLHGLP